MLGASVENAMKHRRIHEQYYLIQKAFRRLASHRPYLIAVASAAFLAVTATTGVLLDQTPAPTAGHGSSTLIFADAMRADVVPPDTPRSESSPAAGTPAQPAAAQPPGAAPPPSSKVLDYEYQSQPNFYWCGPAATRIALTARGKNPAQDYIAKKLGTTVNGTNSANDTTRALNSLGDTDFYHTREIPGRSASPAEMDRLQADVVRAISNGYPVVANVVGAATDTAGGWHGYDGGHYVAIVGYEDDGRTVKVADPANPNVSSYWVTTIDMANWMARRGYSA
jgi:hypothetical protein